MTDPAEKLLVSIEDGIKRITINRPERRNSVDRETVHLLRAAIEQSAEDETRVVILTGAGDSFCAGADLAATSASDIANYDAPSHCARTLTRLSWQCASYPFPSSREFTVTPSVLGAITRSRAT